MKQILETIKDLTPAQTTTYVNKRGEIAIGYNHTIGVYNGQTASINEIGNWLHEDIVALRRAITLSIGNILNKHQERALISLVHDIGLDTFNASKLRQYLLNKQFTLAGNCFLTYNTNKRAVSISVIRRRQMEQNIFNLPCEQSA